MDSISKEELLVLIRGCIKKDRNSQKLLYTRFYSFGIGISLRYSNSKEEAIEILNDSFLKVFSKISSYNFDNSFNGWLRRTIINTALDHYRRNKKHYYLHPIEDEAENIHDDNLNIFHYEELIKIVQRLSPAYRTIFNLYVIEGYTHEEIAEMMHISIGSSKSGLSRARANLREMLKETYKEEYVRYSGQ